MTRIEIDGEEWGKMALENRRLQAQVTELQRDMTNMVERHRLEKVGGILTGKAIAASVARGDIRISGYRPEHINPTSYDLTLGNKVRRYFPLTPPAEFYDCRLELPSFLEDVPEDGIIIRPGELFLMHTAESVHTTVFQPSVEGKSGVARLGIWVHITAGWGEPGFDGQYTLEVTSIYPMKLMPGMKIAQIHFETLAGEVTDYRGSGSYVGENAQGPVASMAWKQFK